MGLIAIVGFWPTYFGPLVRGTIAHPPLIHLHAIVFTGWLALFLAQAVLAATGRLTWHLRLGRIGIGYGVLLIAVGLSTAVIRSAVLPPGEAEGLLFAGFADMTVFSSFFGAAILFRRRPQVHKRLMMVAATTLLIAAVARMAFIPAPPDGLAAFVAIWCSPIVLAMVYDFQGRRLVHPAYLIGLGAFLLRISTGWIAETAAWSTVTGWLAQMVA